MSPWKLVKALDFKQIISLLGWFLRNPPFMIATVSATFKTYRISQREFPDIHGKLNKANAFRHALWNALIARNCSRFSKNMDSVLNWTKKITDWHEEFAPNDLLAKEMDLHNNRIGREVFQVKPERKFVELIHFIRICLVRNDIPFGFPGFS